LGADEHKEFIGKKGLVKKCDRYGKRRTYQVHFDYPKPEILWLFRPEIEVVDGETGSN